jgi:very-short-patch-repair endonuclease
VRRGSGRRSILLDAHQCRLDPRDVTELNTIPITTPARTLLDLAEVVPRDHLDRALERAIQLELYDGFAIASVLERGNGRRGLKPLKAALAALDPDAGRTRSELERRMLALVSRHSIPKPSVNAPLAGYEVDLLWHQQRVVVELDSHEFHGTPQAFERDRRRDARLSALGYRVLRFTWSQVTEDQAFVARSLHATLQAAAPPGPHRPTPPRAPAAAAP